MNGLRFAFQYQNDIKYSIHPSYLTQLREQLLSDIEKRLLKLGYQNGEFEITIQIRQWEYISHQTSFMLSVLMSDDCPDGQRWLGFFDVSAWDKSWGAKPKDPAYNPKRLLDPKKDISDESVKFKIEHNNLMPSMHIIEEQTRIATKNFIQAIESGFRFPCELKCDWPDVIFELYFTDKATEQITHRIEIEFNAFMVKWNKQQMKKDDEEAIHYIANISDTIECPEPNVVYIHVDFGNGSLTVLQKLLEYLNKSEIDIKKVILS